MITHDPAELPEASAMDAPEDHCLEAYCPRCNHAVDAVCPNCRGNVDPSGAIEMKLPAGEFIRRVFTMVMDSRNKSFTICCYLIATGDAYADGKTMTEMAKEFGVTRAAVSKHCRAICAYLHIAPSRYMMKEETAAKYRLSNVRPAKAA